MNEVQLSSSAAPSFPDEIMLIYGSLGTGGIETLVVRIANFFASSTARVAVCIRTSGELESLLDSRVNLLRYTETSDLIRVVRKHQQKMCVTAEVLLLSFDPISAARALMVEATFPRNRRVTHISGVFHPRAYFMAGERKDRIFLNYLVAKAIGKAQMFFMNAESRNAHARKWGTDLLACPLLALPINQVDSRWRPSMKTTVRVVSVGRLVDFKAYNMGAAKISKACLDHGVKITWDIYGYGPERDVIQREIDFWGVTKNVRLMGKLDYSDMAETIAAFDLFVGMGTAALEAAILGLPTICATDSEPTHCYGYLDEIPFGNVGERQAIAPAVAIADLIQQYSALGQHERVCLSNRCRIAAEQYAMPTFANALTLMASSAGAKPSKLIRRSVAEIYRFATESYLVQSLRRMTLSKRCSS